MLDEAIFRQLLHSLHQERAALGTLLAGLDEDAWNRRTECPSYDVKGIASHILGDDLSLLSRQRDGAASGLFAEAIERPGADLRALLDTFNDRWVRASAFLSSDLLVDLLAITGEWTANFFCAVAPDQPGEPVGLFGGGAGAGAGESPMWQSIAREFLERWVHHSQIRRALDLGSLATEPFLTVGIEIVAAITGLAPSSGAPTGEWSLGSTRLGTAVQTADILTRAHADDVLRGLLHGPPEEISALVACAARP